MTQPLFSEEDRVESGGDLPAELVGKSAKEIAEFYANRESTILANANTEIEKAKAGNTSVTIAQPPTPPAKGDMMNMPEAMKKTVIRGAEMLASQGRDDWNRWAPQVRVIMEGLPLDQQADTEAWVVAYNNVRGMNINKITEEAVTRSKVAAEPPSKSSTATSAEPPAELSEKQKGMLTGLGISPERYREAEKQIQEGTWPLTTSNR